jgi:hypothetical protein
MHLVALLASFLISGLVPGPFQMNVMVRGTVVGPLGDRPVAGATVYAVSGTSVVTTTTNAKGRFYFLTLFPGSYRLCATTAGRPGRCPALDNAEPMELYAGFEYLATVWLD